MASDPVPAKKELTIRVVGKIVEYIAELPEDRRKFKITWSDLEKYSGFSRQSLQRHSEIKKAYVYAKQAFLARSSSYASKLAKAKADKKLVAENTALREQVQAMKRREEFWKLRWYGIAYHIRQKGLQMERFDRSPPSLAPPMKIKEIQSILDDWNEDIPPVACGED